MEEKNEIIIDATNAIMGRLASYAAKQALLGKRIIIINCDNVIILGRGKEIIKKYKTKIKKGGDSQKGPKISRTSEKILKRTIRGMLSHKQKRGKEALRRIICYNKTPSKYEKVKKIIAGKEKKGRFITLKQLVGEIGGK